MRHLEDQPFNVKVLTNATFPLKYCQDVIKADSVLIDLSAVDRQQYLVLQGKDLFDRVLSNIEQLVSLRDTVKPGFLVDIVYIVNAANIHHKQKMQELALRLGVNNLHFKKMNGHEFNQDIIIPDDHSADFEGEVKRTPPVCLHGWFYMVVKADDEDTSTCCRIPKMSLGEFDPWSFKKIWLSGQTMNMRLLGKYGQIQKMYKACQTCPFYDKNVKWEKDVAKLGKNAKAIA